MSSTLFLNTNSVQCGIYQFGFNIGKVLSEHSSTYLYAEHSSLEEFESFLTNNNVSTVVVNYNPGSLSWIHTHKARPEILYLNIIHEPGQYDHLVRNCNPYFFHNSFYANPVRKLHEAFFSLPRLLPPPTTQIYFDRSTLKIGSFGFGFLSRGWLQIIDRVQEELDEAEIHFHMPFNSTVDVNGLSHALKTAELCKAKTLKPGIKLSINHQFLTVTEAVDWLGQNTLNLFMSQEQSKVGASSSIDFALAARRPIGINSSPMYDHLHQVRGLISVEKNSLVSIIERGTAVLNPYYQWWSEKTFFEQFESTLTTCREQRK